MWKNLGRFLCAPSPSCVNRFPSWGFVTASNCSVIPQMMPKRSASSISTEKLDEYFKRFSTLKSLQSDLGIDGDFFRNDTSIINSYENELILADVFGLDHISIEGRTKFNEELRITENASKIIETLSKSDCNLCRQEYLFGLCKLVTLAKRNAMPKQQEQQLSQNLLENIEGICQQMSGSELISCLFSLDHLQVPCDNKVMVKILQQLNSILSADASSFSTADLLRYTVYAKLWSKQYQYACMCYCVLPTIHRQLQACEDLSDLFYLTLCLRNIPAKLIPEDVRSTYQNAVKRLINVDTIDYRPLLTIITFISQICPERNIDLVRQLFLKLKTGIANFNKSELELLLRAYQYHLEPADIASAIYERASKLLAEDPSVEAITCSLVYGSLRKRAQQDMYKQILEQAITNGRAVNNMILCRALRSLKLSTNIEDILNKYWDKVTVEIKADHINATGIPARPKNYLDTVIANYFYFNFRCSYRHRDLENLLNQILINDLKSGMSNIIPRKFARYASFIISSSKPVYRDQEIPNFIVAKIEKMVEQFTTNDIVQLSKGVQNYVFYRDRNLKFRKHQKLHSEKLQRIQMALDASMQRHMENPKLNLNGIHTVTKAFNYRNSSQSTPSYDILMHKYDELFENNVALSSSDILRIVNHAYSTIYLSPSIADKILIYMYTNRLHTSGDLMGKVLFCLFILNYESEATKHILFEDLAIAIERDFECMNPYGVVKGCLALCYFRALPYNLIERIFHIDFITRIEDEIQADTSKSDYAEKLSNYFMQLNRAVCFEYPETRVPWFQQSYIEAHISNVPTPQNEFYMDIYKKLVTFVKDEKNLKLNYVTPYGYRIEFLIHLDKNRNLIEPLRDNERNHDIEKFAIIPIHNKSQKRYIGRNLLGMDLLKERHLQMLGYRVVLITQKAWNSMYMNLPGAKDAFLKDMIDHS